MKIKHNLGLLFALLLFVPVFTVILVALSWSSENIEKSALNNLKSAVQLSVQQLSTEFDLVNETLAIYANSDKIQSQDPALFLPYLRGELKRLRPRYEKFIFGLPDGSYYNTAGGNAYQGMRSSLDDSNPTAPLHSIIKRDYWQATIGDNTEAQALTFVSLPMISQTTGVRQIVVARSVISDSRVVGLLAASISWDVIESYVAQLSQDHFAEFNWPARLILTDRAGNYWHHWNPEKIVQRLVDENGQSVVDSTATTVSLISNIKDENIPELNQLYNNGLASGVQAQAFKTSRDASGYYFILQPIPHSSYVLGVIVSQDELLSPLSQLKKKYLWLLIFTLGVGGIAGLFLGNSLSAPIDKLILAAEALSDDKLVPISTDKGPEEVKALSLAFESIRQKLVKKESELATTASRFHYAMLGANDGLWDWNLETNEVFYSPRWVTMLGYDPETFKPNTTSFLQLLHPDDEKKIAQHTKDYLRGSEKSFRTSMRLKHSDGHYVHILSRAFAVRDETSGRALRLVGTHIDISEQVAFEEEIKALNEKLEERIASRTQDLLFAKESAIKAQQQAEEANHAKSRFLANMSHELRTPLNSINGFADRLITRLEGTIESRHMDALKTIARNGRQLLHIINDILDTQRIDTGDVSLKYSLVLIPELFDQLNRTHKAEADKKGIELHFNYPSDIDHRSIYADPVRIRQILENLISNALKFTQKGSVSLRTSVTQHEHRDGMLFQVQDTGQGIETSLLDALFSPFSQADDSDSRPTPGSGLGLTLVRLLTEMHHGVITVTSEIGKGSTFAVWIPDKKP